MRYLASSKEIILATLKEAGKPLRARDIKSQTGLNYNTIRGRLQELKKAGLIKREEKGWVFVK